MNLPIDIKCDVKANFTKPVTILIQKIANATGVFYEPTRIVRKAKAESNAKLIKARTDIEAKKIKKLGELELNDIQQRSVASFVYQQERKQRNIEQIISLALPQIYEDAPTENIDEDWLAYFFAHCELVSDKDMQILWANLLAGESSKNSSFSKRTIDFVATMSRKKAQLFTIFCEFSVLLNNKKIPLIIEKNSKFLDLYINKNITDEIINHFIEIGLIYSSNFIDSLYHEDCQIRYFDKPIVFFEKELSNNIQIWHTSFTQIGKELASICGAQANNEFYEYLFNLWKENIIK